MSTLDLPPRVTELVQRLVEPLVRINVVDRSLTLGAQAFSAVIPLLVVLQAAQPGQRSAADELIDRFGLEGSAAASVRAAFSVPESAEGTTTVLGVVLLIVSALSFTRRLQRLYEETWGLSTRGIRATGWGLLWLAVLALYASLHPVLDSELHGGVGVVASLIGIVAVWLLTPYVLLGRRVPPRALLFQASLTAFGSLLLGVWTAIYMPRAIAASAGQYGVIGVAFALLTWLWGMGIVIVCGAVYGVPRDRQRGVIGADSPTTGS